MRQIIKRAGQVVERARFAWMALQMQISARHELDQVTEAAELAAIARGWVL